MGKKIKITEKQFNMIVESVIKKQYVNENINEEQLEEGKLSQIAGALAILATTLFPGKSEAAAVSQMQKEYPELVQKVQSDTSKMGQGYDLMGKTKHGDFLKSLNKVEKDIIFGPKGFQKRFLPNVLGTSWDSIKNDSYNNYIKKLYDVLGSRKYDDGFTTNSIEYFKDNFGEDNVKSLQQKLANAGYTQYKPDGSKGKSNIDGDFGTGTSKMIIDMMVKRLDAVKDKSANVGVADIDPSKFGEPSKEVGVAQKTQPKKD
jgi:hypothetical protein